MAISGLLSISAPRIYLIDSTGVADHIQVSSISISPVNNGNIQVPCRLLDRKGDFHSRGSTAGIEEMEVIREWRSALKNAIGQGFPVSENWVDNYRARAEQSLRLASLAVSTDSDRSAFELLTNEFKNMRKLSDRFVEAGKGRVYVSPKSLDDDPLDQQILKCARALAAMVANNQFVDDGSCH